MARGSEGPAGLRSPGLGTAAEVAKRLTLWEEVRFEDLLRRAEEQHLIHRKAGKRKKRDAQPDPPARADRARRTASVGAYRKATTGLVSSMLSLSRRTSPGPMSFSPPLWRGTSSAPFLGEDWDRPFAGLHYAALTAPVPNDGSTPTSSTRRCQLCSDGSLLARFPLPLAGSRARGSAGSARRTASRDPSRWGNSCVRPRPSGLTISIR